MSVTATVGPISGIDYGTLITGLSAVQQAQIDALGKRATALDDQNTAILGLSTLMTGLKISAANFGSSAIFRAAAATSSNTGIVNATAGIGTPTGNYQFNVQRLASASQLVTQGFADSTNTALGLSGTLKFQLGGGLLNDAAKLPTLNGGSGVARGSIRVTDRSGASTLIDLTHAVDINDVVNTINSSTGVNVVAKVDGDRLVLTDNTGGSGTLAVTNAGGTTTAADLGLTGAAVGGTLTGSSLTGLKATTGLDALNDGNGVRTVGILNDFSITGAGGPVQVSLNGAKTIGDVVSKINAAGQSAGLSAAISADGHGITLTDSGGGPVTVAALNGSLAAYDLGILGTGSGGTLTGDRVAGSLVGPLLRDLNGGNQGQAGLTLPTPGTVTINSQTIDLSSARTLNDVINTLNTNSQGVTAALNDAGNGIVLSSSAGSFTVADGTGNLASFLHLAGTSTATGSGSSISSGDLRLRYISNNTQLSTLNGGTGVRLGTIQVTGPATGGGSATVTLDLSSAKTIGDVLNRLNTSGVTITARVNDTGDGILITQTSGTAQVKISDVNGGTTASDLGIAGTLSSNTLDGSFQKSITILATDKLSDIATKINNANAGVAASIINDGSGATPFRLSLSSRNSGEAGRLIFDGSGVGLETTTLVQGQDAALVYGGNANGTGGLLATSSNNAFSSLVPGLSLNLTGVGNATVAVTNDTSKISDAVQGFVDAYNKVINNVADVTKFDPNNAANNGVLFGHAAVQQVQDALGSFITNSYRGAGQFKTLASVGISIGQDGTLSLDTSKLDQALATDPADVRALFTTNVRAIAGGPQAITSSTKLSTLNGSTSFPAGHISITDGFGTSYDIDLSAATTIGDVISKINAGTTSKVTAGINSAGTGLMLMQVGGTSQARVAEVGGGTTAAFLNIKGTFTNGTLSGALPPILPTSAVKGVGSTLSDLLDRFTNAQDGMLFQTSTSLLTQEQQIKDRQQSLAELLILKKNQMVQQFANLEVTIAQLQQQGTALASFKPFTLSTSSSSKG